MSGACTLWNLLRTTLFLIDLKNQLLFLIIFANSCYQYVYIDLLTYKWFIYIDYIYINISYSCLLNNSCYQNSFVFDIQHRFYIFPDRNENSYYRLKKTH